MRVLQGLLAYAAGLGADGWKDRIVYQVITDRFANTTEELSSCDGVPGVPNCQWGAYCGGVFTGLQHRLDYIKEMGFDSIWISPVPENTECGYHGYWASNFFEVNPQYGTKAQLQELVEAAHNKSMLVMVDVVFNHVGPGVNLTADHAYRGYPQFNLTEDYHLPCPRGVNTSNQTSIEDCWLATLPDLDQSIPSVTDTLLVWIKDLIATFKFDGIRIDTVPYVPKSFWKKLRGEIFPGTYSVGEVLIPDKPFAYAASYQDDPTEGPLLDAVLNYPMFWPWRDAYRFQGSLTAVAEAAQWVEGNFTDPSVLGNFLDNHDQPRFLFENNNVVMLRNNLATLYGWPGIPIVYYGTEALMATGGSDTLNRDPLWRHPLTPGNLTVFFAQLAGVRRTIPTTTPLNVIYADNCALAFARGDVLFVSFNAARYIGIEPSVAKKHPWTSRDQKIREVLTGLTGSVGEFEDRDLWTEDGEPQIWVLDGEDLLV